MDRGQSYGDGFFESILALKGRIPLLKLHYERILKTASFLKFIVPAHFLTLSQFEAFLKSYMPDYYSGRIKLTVVRDGDGLYLPVSNLMRCHVRLSEAANPFNHSGKFKNKVEIAEKITVYSGGLGNYKLLARSEQVLLSIENHEKNTDDLMVLNEKSEIVECISSNIFFIDSAGKHFYPPLSSGCLDGVMRRAVLEFCKESGINCVEIPIKPADIYAFKAAYCTNAIQGVVPIAKIGNNVFDLFTSFQFSTNILNYLIKNK